MSSYLGIESLVSSLIFRRLFVTGSLDFFCIEQRLGDSFWWLLGGTSLGCCAGGWPLCLVHLLLMRCPPLLFPAHIGHYSWSFLAFASCSERASGAWEQVWRAGQAAVEYARTIEDFDELIDPCTLTRHYLGPEFSLYVLSALNREEKKRKLPLYTWWPFFSFLFFF